MGGMEFKRFSLAVALAAAILVNWAVPGIALSREHDRRIQDYDEYDEAEDYGETEDYGESEDYADSDSSEGYDESGNYPDTDADDAYEESEVDHGFDAEDDFEGFEDSEAATEYADSDDDEGEDEPEEFEAFEESQAYDDAADQDDAVDYADEGYEEAEGDEEEDYFADDSDAWVDADFEDEYFFDELEDDSWAPDIEFDEADDVLQTETANWGDNEVYEVVESTEQMNWSEEIVVESATGGPGSGDMPVVQRVVREPDFARPAAQAGSTGRKPTTSPQGATAPRKPAMKSSFGGRPVANSGVPWQAQIYAPFPAKTWPAEKRAGKALWQLQHYCGGILIAEDWVLTAAHCIDQEMVESGYRIRLGSRDISREDGWTYKIDRIVRHSGYAQKPLPNNPNMYANDIALIHIVNDGKARPRDPNRIKVIPLYRGKTLPAGTEVTGTGWGLSQSAENALPNAVLLKVDLRVMDGPKCRSLRDYGPQKIGNGVFCAANPARSTCRGDSGGPVILTNGKPAVVGIVSWGKKRCSGDGHPGVYTRISSYLPWIDQAMKLPPGKNSLP